MSDTLYIDKLTYQELGSRTAKVFSQNTLDEKKITKVISLISQEKISLIDAINEEECVSITIRIDEHKFWIGILDSLNEVSYIYDNLSGNENYIAVGGDDYPGWAFCDDIELVKQIFMEFVHDGTRHNSVTWREDDM